MDLCIDALAMHWSGLFAVVCIQRSVLVLDLYSDMSPQMDRRNGYYGQPSIWCALHNFGGRLGFFGNNTRDATVR